MTIPTTRTSWQLARLAECADPDEHDGRGFSEDQQVEPRDGSPGAQFLRRCENAAYDVLGDAETINDNPGDTFAERAEYTGRLSEEADSTVPIYTHERWTTFADLAAYDEDTDELAGPDTDMTSRAGIALYMIAERLIRAIIAEETEQDEDEDENDD